MTEQQETIIAQFKSNLHIAAVQYLTDMASTLGHTISPRLVEGLSSMFVVDATKAMDEIGSDTQEAVTTAYERHKIYNGAQARGQQ